MPVYSMTGYASVQSPGHGPTDHSGHAAHNAASKERLGLEIRSVNSRFLDLSFRLSDELRVNYDVIRSQRDALLDAHRQKIELAITDALTGLYNRRYLETHLSHLVEHSNSRGKALAVAALDVDFFKAINDTYGHDAGDKVLQELSQRIKFNTRSIDLCCRVGGEEFILILPGTDMDLAGKIAERLRRSVATKPFTIDQHRQITVTLSAGISNLLGPEDTVEKLLKRADQALYSAKREGRNRVISAAA